ncbi:MAG TPA: response regulator [Candidatus Binatia bacterium]|nr:response regulator [Candidatus Binatia bacterium]
MAKILVIDDDPSVRELIREFLQPDGHALSEAGNGEEGLQLHGQSPADIIISDIFMPGKDGLQVIRTLARTGVRLIAISGGMQFDNADFLNLARKLGAVQVLYKPFDKQQLRTAVAAALANGVPVRHA